MFFFSSRRRHTRWPRDWSSDVCSSDLDRPVEDVVIEKVSIIKKGDKYKNYNGGKAFDEAQAKLKEKLAEMEAEANAEKAKQIQRKKDLTSKAQSTESGLMYNVEKQGSVAKPNHGETLKINYYLKLNKGEQLD